MSLILSSILCCVVLLSLWVFVGLQGLKSRVSDLERDSTHKDIMLSEIVKQVKKNKMKSIVEQIHEEFNNSQSQLLLSKPNASAECLYKLGFFKSKSADDYYIHNDYTREIAQYFQTNYPNYRYVTEKQVELICKKYGLLCATVDRYTGEVPASKIAAMTAFRIKRCDAYSRHIGEWGIERQPVINNSFSFLRSGKTPNDDPNELITAQGLWICAPESEIDTEGLTKVGHNVGIQVKDPVVLQPVNEGFLIVTAWGEEASDENVVNTKMN